jgi:hypothetical protein
MVMQIRTYFHLYGLAPMWQKMRGTVNLNILEISTRQIPSLQTIA